MTPRTCQRCGFQPAFPVIWIGGGDDREGRIADTEWLCAVCDAVDSAAIYWEDQEEEEEDGL